MRSAFSLVELSIVLVILGLLTGGILAGQSLIRASELRAVTSEYQRYAAAVNTFRDKYFALPGDMTNATSFWLKDNTNCAGDTGTAAAAGAGTCNGNGNGMIGNGAGGGATGEQFQYWRQLAFAGLIEGTYSGLASAGSAYDTTIGTNVPRSKLSNVGWSVRYLTPTFGGDASTWYALDFGNFLMVGTHAGTWQTEAAAFKPEEAWNVDTKMDDGLPAQGKIIALGYLACTTSANQTAYSGTYRLDSTATACALGMRQQF